MNSSSKPATSATIGANPDNSEPRSYQLPIGTIFRNLLYSYSACDIQDGQWPRSHTRRMRLRSKASIRMSRTEPKEGRH
jgi:hypothetical protein